MRLRKPPADCPNDGACVTTDNEIAKLRGWHLDRSVSVGHLLTTLAVAVSFVGFAIAQDRRLTTLELHDMQNQKDHKEQDIGLREKLSELKTEQKEQRQLLEQILRRR